MAKQDLLAEIEADVLSDRPLADALRKCVVLGGKAGSVELREWATRELRGYEGVPEDDLPPYRVVAAVILADAHTGSAIVRGQQIDATDLPDVAQEGGIGNEVALRGGVAELEALRATAERDGGGVKLSLPGALMLGKLMDHASGNRYQQITALYWSVSSASIAGVIDQVRTTLTELVAEMRAGTPGEATPTAELADQAVNIAVHGRGARITVTSAQASGGATASASPVPSRVENGFWTFWRKVGAVIVGVATVAAAWFGWLALDGSEAPPPAPTTTSAPP